MKQRLQVVFKGPVVFHPLLFAAFPVLFLYAHNISQTAAGEVWLPLAIAVSAALVLWAILSRVVHSLAKAGLATAIFLALFFSYGRLHGILAHQGLFLANHYLLLPATLLIWVGCLYSISRAKRDFRITTRLFNIVAVVLIAINLFSIAVYQVRSAGMEVVAPEGWQQQPAADPPPGALPDIYFIIPDEYAHPDTMRQYYDYDIGWFFKTLEDRGFFVAYGSETPARSTAPALASVLNMELIGDEAPDDRLHSMIAYNRAAEFLRSRGYRFVYFGNGHDLGRWYTHMGNAADDYFNYYRGATTDWISEFQEILWNTTMLKPLFYRLAGTEYETAQRRQTLFTLEHLKELPGTEGPKFVVAHLYCPHVPFVFGPEGQHVAAENWVNFEEKAFYLGEYIFISREMEQVVDALLGESQTPPIIILQSDHGLRGGYPVGGDEWRKILNAMYLPGMDHSELSESISPVNTFRLIFNHYFGADYELIEDG